MLRDIFTKSFRTFYWLFHSPTVEASSPNCYSTREQLERLQLTAGLYVVTQDDGIGVSNSPKLLERCFDANERHPKTDNALHYRMHSRHRPYLDQFLADFVHRL